MSPDEISAALARKRMTKRGLALRLGVSETTVQSWLTGKHAPDDFHERLLRVVLDSP